MSDKEYFTGIKKRVVAIENHFYESNWKLVSGMIRKMDTSGSCDPQDIYQDAVSVVISNIRTGKLTVESMSSKLSTYLVSVAKNLLRNHFKNQKPMMDIHLVTENLLSNEDEFHLDEIAGLEALILNIVKQIKEPCSGMLMDRYVNSLSYDHIAKKYNYKNYNGAKKKNGECLQKARFLVKQSIGFQNVLNIC